MQNQFCFLAASTTHWQMCSILSPVTLHENSRDTKQSEVDLYSVFKKQWDLYLFTLQGVNLPHAGMY